MQGFASSFFFLLPGHLAYADDGREDCVRLHESLVEAESVNRNR